jgi:WD40 repeat protein
LRGPTPSRFAFSPDGKHLAAASSEGDTVLWDTATGEEVRRFPAVPGAVLAVAFTPDGKHLVAGAGTSDKAPGLWGLQTGKLVRRFTTGAVDGVTDLALSPDGSVLATSNNRNNPPVLLWDVATGKLLRTLAGHSWWNPAVAFAPDGKTVAIGGYQKICLRDVATGREVRQMDHVRAGALSLAFAPDGKSLAAVLSAGKGAQLWDVATGRLVRSFPGSRLRLDLCFGPHRALFSRDGKALFHAAEDRTIRLWDVTTGKERACLGGTGFPIALSRDGKLLATGSCNADGGIRLWDARTLEERCVFPGHRRPLSALAYSPDSKSIATAGADGMVHVWGPTTGQHVLALPAHREPALSVGWSPDGRTLATAGNTVHLWEAGTGKSKGGPPPGTTAGPPLLFHPDGKSLIVRSGDSEVLLWDLVAGRVRARFHPTPHTLLALALAPDGKQLAVGCNFNWLSSWGLAGPKERWRAQIGWSRSLAFSPEGNWLYSSVDPGRIISVRRASTGKEVRQIGPYPDLLFALSPDGRALATTGLAWNYRDHCVRLIEVCSGAERCSSGGHRGRTSAIAFAPDGKTFATAGDDCTGLVWDVRALAGVKRARAEQPRAAVLEAAWEELASPDAARAFKAMGQLWQAPARTVALLEKRLTPARAPNAREIERLIHQLVDDDGKARAVAETALVAWDRLAEAALRRTVQTSKLPQLRESAARVLAKLDGPITVGALLRQVRSVEVLEHLGTPAARRALERLAGGAAEARLTQEALSALTRSRK